MILQTSNNRHWNYLLALDADAAAISRYIEFTTDNFRTYSVELARLLMSAASEVDVVAKLACAHVSQKAVNCIADYQSVLVPARQSLPTYPITIARFGLDMKPWSNWAQGKTPDWWRAYNDVKHERNNCFHLANLENALNALAGLFVMLIYAFPTESTQGLLTPPELLAVPEDAHDGWMNMGTYTTVHYRL